MKKTKVTTEDIAEITKIVSQRLFVYFIQIINMKKPEKEMGLREFVIDKIPGYRKTYDIISFINKYDRLNSNWRNEFDFGEFRPGRESPIFEEILKICDCKKINIEQVFEEVISLLKEKGIEAYFQKPDLKKQSDYFCFSDEKWLYVVLP